MYIYVAGSSSDLARVREVQTVLRAAGHSIIYDWTAAVEKFGAVAASEEENRRQVDLDIRGVARADCLVAVVEGRGTCGMGFELGLAYAWRIARVTLGHHDHVFGTVSPSVRDIPELITWLNELSSRLPIPL